MLYFEAHEYRVRVVRSHRVIKEMLEEHFFTCPYCWETISVLLDLSIGSQSYVEDCEVCCNPISIFYESDDGAVTAFSADSA